MSYLSKQLSSVLFTMNKTLIQFSSDIHSISLS